jgi:DNA-binding transcriptional regulator PaaX
MFAFFDTLTSAFSSKEQWGKESKNIPYKKYYQTVYHLNQEGLIKITKTKAGKKILRLTGKGQLELLMAKAWLPKQEVWDGKWRMVMFDIPREASSKRDMLRRLLKIANFYKLQASVYITPYPLNREAITSLKKSGLINYIRMGRIEELDDDSDLIKYFKLTRPV